MNKLKLLVLMAVSLAWAPGSATAEMNVGENFEVLDPQCLNVAWNETTRIVVEMDEFFFHPKEIVLKACKPYAITLINTGKHKHSYIAPAFYRTVYVKGEENVAPHQLPKDYQGMFVESGEEQEMILIPTVLGEFRVKCTTFAHDLFGMKGIIKIVE